MTSKGAAPQMLLQIRASVKLHHACIRTWVPALKHYQVPVPLHGHELAGHILEGSAPRALNVSAIPSVQRRLSDGHARERAVKQAPGFPDIQSRDERIATRSRSDRFTTTAKRMDLDPMRPSPDREKHEAVLKSRMR